MRDILKDIVKHTHSLGIIEAAKVTTDGEATKIDAMDNDRSVVLRAKLHDRVDDFDGKFGLGRLAVLNGYLNFETENAEGKSAGANINVVRTERNGENVPAELKFKMGKLESTYRVIVGEMVDAQIKTANFKGAQWDIDIMPTQKSIKELQYFAGVLGAYDPLFTVATVDDTLMFYIGDQSTDRVEIPFAQNISGNLSSSWSYPLQAVLTILKLGESGTMSVKFSNQGAMMIQVDSGLGLYEYILPAKSGN